MGVHQRGFALIEILVVGVIGTVVLLGIYAMYLNSARAWSQSQAQAALQRQGTLIEQEMTRVILPASTTLTPCGPTAFSVGVEVPAGTLPDFPGGGFACFYWEGNVAVAAKIMECRFQSPGNTACLAGTPRDLTAGAPRPHAVEATRVSFSFPWGPFLPGGRMVPVEFDIVARHQDVLVAGPMRFSTRITIRN